MSPQQARVYVLQDVARGTYWVCDANPQEIWREWAPRWTLDEANALAGKLARDGYGAFAVVQVQ